MKSLAMKSFAIDNRSSFGVERSTSDLIEWGLILLASFDRHLLRLLKRQRLFQALRPPRGNPLGFRRDFSLSHYQETGLGRNG